MVEDTQLDTCWLENNGRYAYGANDTSGTISRFRIQYDGRVELLEAVAGTTHDWPGPQPMLQREARDRPLLTWPSVVMDAFCTTSCLGLALWLPGTFTRMVVSPRSGNLLVCPRPLRATTHRKNAADLAAAQWVAWPTPPPACGVRPLRSPSR